MLARPPRATEAARAGAAPCRTALLGLRLRSGKLDHVAALEALAASKKRPKSVRFDVKAAG